MDRLFVYGTLRPGSENEQAQALAAHARLMGGAQIRGRLFRVAHYPGLVAPAGKDDLVYGDVFEGVTSETIRTLDEYEGDEYSRQLAEVRLDDGQHVTVYLYLYKHSTDGLELIKSGDWNDFISASSPLE